MKKIIIAIMCICIAFSASTPFAFASVDDNLVIEPMAENYGTATAELMINSGTAYCSTIVDGISGKTTKIMIRMYLQEYSGNSWKTIDNWTTTKSVTSLNFEKTATVASGERYRVKADITVYAGIERESITKYSSVVNY